MIVLSLPVIVSCDGCSLQDLRISDRPVCIIKLILHELPGLISCLQLDVLGHFIDLICEGCVQMLGCGAIVACVMVPGRLAVRIRHLTNIRLMPEIIVNCGSNDKYIAHRSVLDCGACATNADDIGIREVKA